MANRINGWLRQREPENGMTWLWCYQRLRPSDGKMVENAFPLGLVAEIEMRKPRGYGLVSFAWSRSIF
jgi:hypothetical protein